MKRNFYIIGVIILLIIAGIWIFLSGGGEEAQDGQAPDDKGSPMSFFVNSRNPGRGSNLGGLAGAGSSTASPPMSKTKNPF